MLHTTAQMLLGVLVSLLFFGHVGMPFASAPHQESAQTLNELALSYEALGEFDKAIEAFREAIDQDPSVAEYHFNLAFMYNNCQEAATRVLGIGQEQLYGTMLEESLKVRSLKPDDLRSAKTYATYCLLFEDFGVSPDWDRALDAWQYCLTLHEQAYEKNPSTENDKARVHALLQLGRIQLELHRKEEARTYILKALSIFPRSTVAQHLLDRC